MLYLRHTLAAAVTAVMLVPAAPALASPGPLDLTDTVRSLAADGAELVAEEQDLLAMAHSENPTDAAEVDEARARLRAIDGQAFAVLAQLDAFDVELTEAVRTAMDRLPSPPPGTSAEDVARLVPPSIVYSVAIDDLTRIAQTPTAVIPTNQSSGSSSFSLLIVAAASLVALGLAALVNTLRRRSDSDELNAMVWSDGLTGLANRRRLDHDLISNQSKPANVTTSVIMIDVDHFKLVNDRHGHTVGDEILRKVGAMLTLSVRHDDVVYRYGGEEFCILLPNTSTTDAERIAQRVVDAAHDITTPDGSNITVSVGVAAAPAAEVSDAVRTADQALFSAKADGRDRVVAADQHPIDTPTLTTA